MDLLNDKGEFCWGKLQKASTRRVFDTDSFKDIAEAINAHIASLKQETPITPELLERAGFVVDNLWYFRKGRVIVGYTEKELKNFDRVFFGSVCMGSVKTMEELSELHRFYAGQPLNWQHDPAAELRKRLEDMGFKFDPQWRKYVINIDYMRIVVDCDHFDVSAAFKPFDVYNKLHEVKTIDQLEKLVGVLKGE
jgi:hypothetical protein